MGLSQSGLASRLRVWKNTVARMERDEQRITAPMELLIRLVEAGCDLTLDAGGVGQTASPVTAGRTQSQHSKSESRSRSRKNPIQRR
jgi:transcriptional regulator with XRE-family HTH domain